MCELLTRPEATERTPRTHEGLLREVGRLVRRCEAEAEPVHVRLASPDEGVKRLLVTVACGERKPGERVHGPHATAQSSLSLSRARGVTSGEGQCLHARPHLDEEGRDVLLEPHGGKGGEVSFDEALRLPESGALCPVLPIQPGGKQVGVGVHVVPEDVEGLAGKALVDGCLHAARRRKDGEQTLPLKAVRSVRLVRPREDEAADQDCDQDRNQGRHNTEPSAGGHGSMLAYRG